MKKATSKLILLDVNVLLAIAWPNHQFHGAATRALAPAGVRWSTCALTELGFIRLSSNPAVVYTAMRPSGAAAMLAALTADSAHVYLEDLPSPAGSEFRPAFQGLLGHQQVSDSYLLALARRSGAVFVTFDKRLAATGDSGTRVELPG